MSVKSTVTILVATSIAIAAGAWYSGSLRNNKQQQMEAARKEFSAIQGNVLSPARKIAIPALQKDDGSSFTAADLQGHWSILFFGFTHCSEVCPVTMSKLAQARKMAEDRGIDFPQVFLVSIDPERDDLLSLKKFVSGFDKDFTGVAGNAEAIKALSLQMSVVYMRAEQSGTDDNYQVDHSSALLLLNPHGSLKAFLNPPLEADRILKDIETVKQAETTE